MDTDLHPYLKRVLKMWRAKARVCGIQRSRVKRIQDEQSYGEII